MLPTISLCPLHYRGQEAIALSSKLPKDLELEVRKIKAIKWCGEKSCWYLPLTRENYLKIKSSLQDKVVVNIEPLKKYLEQKKAVQPGSKKQAISKTRAQLLIHF